MDFDALFRELLNLDPEKLDLPADEQSTEKFVYVSVLQLLGGVSLLGGTVILGAWDHRPTDGEHKAAIIEFVKQTGYLGPASGSLIQIPLNLHKEESDATEVDEE